MSTVHVALTELVKNAYDADASTVLVKIDPQEDEGPRIVVEDNGTGMRLQQVHDFWMKIGTTNKVAAPTSGCGFANGRPRRCASHGCGARP